MSPVPESVIFIARIGCGLGRDARPRRRASRSTRRTPAAMRRGALVVGHGERPAVEQRRRGARAWKRVSASAMRQPDRAAADDYDVIRCVAHRPSPLSPLCRPLAVRDASGRRRACCPNVRQIASDLHNFCARLCRVMRAGRIAPHSRPAEFLNKIIMLGDCGGSLARRLSLLRHWRPPNSNRKGHP